MSFFSSSTIAFGSMVSIILQTQLFGLNKSLRTIPSLLILADQLSVFYISLVILGPKLSDLCNCFCMPALSLAPSDVIAQSKQTSHVRWCRSSSVQQAFLFDMRRKISSVFFDLRRKLDFSRTKESSILVYLVPSISSFLFQSSITQHMFSTQKKFYASKHFISGEMYSFSTQMKTRPSFMTSVEILKLEQKS